MLGQPFSGMPPSGQALRPEVTFLSFSWEKRVLEKKGLLI
jgi:hypothetical protein